MQNKVWTKRPMTFSKYTDKHTFGRMVGISSLFYCFTKILTSLHPEKGKIMYLMHRENVFMLMIRHVSVYVYTNILTAVVIKI